MASRPSLSVLVVGVLADWHFVSSLLTFGLVPLLGLIGTQVPAAGQLLNGWLKPLMRLAGVG